MTERKHCLSALDKNHYVKIKYTIESSLGPVENYRYRQAMNGKILPQDEHGEEIEETGWLYIDKLLFGVGMGEGWDHFNIFNTGQYLMDPGNAVWDFEKNDFTPALLKFFHHDLTDMDILNVHPVKIVPAYRGMQIGERAMKEAANSVKVNLFRLGRSQNRQQPLSGLFLLLKQKPLPPPSRLVSPFCRLQHKQANR